MESLNKIYLFKTLNQSNQPGEQVVEEEEEEDELVSTVVDLAGESMLSKVVTDYTCARKGQQKSNLGKKILFKVRPLNKTTL